MLRFAVMVALALTSLATSETTLGIFSTPLDYLDFTTLKSCIGENATIDVWRLTLNVGRACLRQEEEEKNRKLLQIPDGEGGPLLELHRQKRNVLRIPAGSSIPLQLCNLRALNLMTKDNRINAGNIARWADDVIGDTVLKEKIQESIATCQSESEIASSPKSRVSENEGFWNLVSFLKCLSKGGLLACQDYEIRRYSQVFN